MAQEAIDKKFLAGLKHRSSKQKSKEEKNVFIPTERPLQPGDVLDWSEKGNILTIVTADGQKHKVNKNKPGKAEPEEGGEGKTE